MIEDNKKIVEISENNAHDVIKEIEEAFYDIPFENSEFQTENFVIASSITPERAYRNIGLKMHKKLIAVQEALLAKEMDIIEEEEIKDKLNSDKYNNFQKRKLEIALKRKHINKSFSEKLLNDAIKELNILYKHFKSLPKYTREQFEAGEKRYFLESLNRQALDLSGAKQALINMFDDVHSIKNFEEQFKLISNNYDTKLLQEFTEKTLTNISKKEQK